MNSKVISWTRNILMPLAIVSVVCAIGSAAVLVGHRQPANREMYVAAIITLVAAELALVPMWIVRHKAADAAVQGALVATVVHMGVCAAAGLMFQQWGHPAPSFLYWLCGLYWATLVGVCRVLMRVVRAAAVPDAKQALAGK